MGPLVPDIIGNDLNFIIAIFIGIAFGYILEQAGFSTSKKLVGLFYGYDFTVLRVFFTAGVTAMLGVVAMGHFGLLDLSLIYVNPTFLWSAIVGGLIMGLGFVIGGFCPGTSVCAAAIGKIDAMIFIAGSFAGVFIFAEGYPLFEGLYKATPWGNVRIFDVLGISQGLFAFLLTFVAVFAFWAVTVIENKVNKRPNPKLRMIPAYVALTVIAIVLGLTAFAMPERKEAMLKKYADNNYVNKQTVKLMDSDELAFMLMDDDSKLQILDFRPQSDFDSLKLPHSHHFELQNLFEKEAHNLLVVKNKKNVFIGANEIESKRAAALASELGYDNVFALKGGMEEFLANTVNYSAAAPDSLDHMAFDTYRFRMQAKAKIPELIKEAAKSAGAAKEWF